MFGLVYTIEENDLKVTLKPFSKTQAEDFAPYVSNPNIRQFTLGIFGQTAETEAKWYDRVAENEDLVIWGIFVNDLVDPVGTTSIHDFRNVHNTCTTGIMIFKEEWLGKNVGSLAHLVRTQYAAKVLNLSTIKSVVLSENERSWKALLRVGYAITGRYVRSFFVNGAYKDAYTLTWFNPYRIDLLFPEGLPDEFKVSVEQSRLALEKAGQLIK